MRLLIFYGHTLVRPGGPMSTLFTDSSLDAKKTLNNVQVSTETSLHANVTNKVLAHQEIQGKIMAELFHRPC